MLDGVYEDPPIVLVPTDPRSRRRFLIISYGLRRGLDDRWGAVYTLRAYVLRNGRFRLAGATSADLDGYTNIDVKALVAPIENEEWLLLMGQAIGANGPNRRLRVYAFDGKQARAVWMPENAWGDFKTSVVARGFRVDGLYYQENNYRHDWYYVTADGVYRHPR